MNLTDIHQESLRQLREANATLDAMSAAQKKKFDAVEPQFRELFSGWTLNEFETFYNSRISQPLKLPLTIAANEGGQK